MKKDRRCVRCKLIHSNGNPWSDWKAFALRRNILHGLFDIFYYILAVLFVKNCVPITAFPTNILDSGHCNTWPGMFDENKGCVRRPTVKFYFLFATYYLIVCICSIILSDSTHCLESAHKRWPESDTQINSVYKMEPNLPENWWSCAAVEMFVVCLGYFPTR